MVDKHVDKIMNAIFASGQWTYSRNDDWLYNIIETELYQYASEVLQQDQLDQAE